MNPIVVEIGKAWEAARNSPIWKEVFVEHKINDKELVYLRHEYENECEIAKHLNRIVKGKKPPFERMTHSLCGIDFDSG